MKNRTKINIKALGRSLYKKYGTSELFPLLDGYVEALNGRIKYPAFFERVGECSVTEPSEVASRIGNKYTYSELSCFYDYAALQALLRLESEPESDSALGKTVDHLKALCSVDVNELYYALSEAERRISESEYFSGCDDATKNECRRRITRCAKKRRITESEAAALYTERDPFEERNKLPSLLYFPVLALISAAFAVTVLLVTRHPSIFFFVLLPVIEAAKQITDFIFSHAVKSAPIPKKKLDNVPDGAKTLTVITALLSGSDSGKALARRIRDCAYANRYENALFGLLLDLPESDSPVLSSDRERETALTEEINALNGRYGTNITVFLRDRKYAPTEGKYMGWERKRGAVIELTRYLRGEHTSIRVIAGDISDLKDIKYVITLDSDTRLYKGAVTDLLGAMLHPSNKPIIKNGRVVKGHAILQPRMEASLISAEKTPFAVLSAGNGGTDIYASAAYETYQSVFGEGIFCGKGIFDLEVFSELIDGAFPDGAVLSHDLLEGSRLRAGAVTDIVLTDDLPKNPLSCFERSHRWVRGDVQALAFAGKYVRDENGNRYLNPISRLSTFKIIDNLRRALTPISALAALLLCIFRPPEISPLTAVFALSYIFIPFLLSLGASARGAGRRYFSHIIPEVLSSLFNLLYSVSSLLHTALRNLDAVLRSGYRMLFSGKRLLEWRTASESEAGIRGLPRYLYSMLPSLLIGLSLLVLCPKVPLRIFGALSAFFPFAAYLIGKGFSPRERIGEEEDTALREYASDIWRFFSEHVGRGDNYLPPDNVQLSPDEKVAHRTSPTNIGLYLTSCVSAEALGLITEHEMLSRIKNTLDTVDELPSYRGHLYNWYDTEKLFILGQSYISTVDSGNFITALVALKELLYDRGEKGRELSERMEKRIRETDFSVLYDERKRLMLIGLNPERSESDPPCYDFFTSEERTTSFYAIASGAVPREHWRYLRRIPTARNGYTGLMSWTGTAFEYLMPALFLPARQGSLSYEALSFAVREQKRRVINGVWGISESGYFDFDRDLNYQYKAFGVPSLGLKGGLGRDFVVSPYSSFLSLPFGVREALGNLKRLTKKGMYGVYGFYEALDMTPARVGAGYAVIKSYMSHHLGMSLTAIANACLDNIFVNAFMSDPYASGSSELLDERVPRAVRSVGRRKKKGPASPSPLTFPRFDGGEEQREDESSPQMLSENGLSAIILDDTLRLSALKGDVSVDPFVFGRHFRPRLLLSLDGRVYDLMAGRAGGDGGRISRVTDGRSFGAEMSLSLLGRVRSFVFSVSAEGHFERICPMLVLFPSLSSSKERLSHPSYADLEVVSEYRERERALLYIKRGRSASERERCFALSFESGSGSAEFLTRRSVLPPMYGESDIEALIRAPFDNRDGTLIEPLCALKKESVSRGRYLSNIILSVGYSKDEAIRNLLSARRLLKTEHGKNGAKIAERLCLQGRENRLLALDPTLKRLMKLLLSSVLLGGSEEAPKGMHTVNELYSHGISGDNPIICLKAFDGFSPASPVVKWLELFILCHKLLALSGIRVDTVIFYDGGGEYLSSKKEAITAACERCAAGFFLKGGIYLIDGEEELDLLRGISSAYACLDKSFTLDAFEERNKKTLASRTVPIRAVSGSPRADMPEDALSVYGGYFYRGGFCLKKKERGEKRLPHSYVYALNHFGTLVTDSSLGYTWIGNSHERRITPYLPDSLLQMSGEVLTATILDTEYDLVAASHTAFFTKGGAVWEGKAGAVEYKVTATVDPSLPVKVVTVEYSEGSFDTEYRIIPVLGDIPRRSRPIRTVREEGVTKYIPTVTDGVSDTGFLIKREFGSTICFLLGAYPSDGEGTLDHIIGKYEKKEDFLTAAERYEERLEALLPSLSLELPDRYLSVMAEYYLPYQSLVCRFFGRTGFYQSGGAYGFRDQLQDCLSIMLSAPHIAKTHILRCACRQYEEGDVNHWWHVKGGVCRGVRTRYTDDLLWLPYVASKYAAFTGDYGIFDIELPYIKSPPLRADERDRYECPERSKYRSPLYFHCVKAIERSLSFGSHGLPLMGGGDWNDGMNEVGEGGGESVWLGMFLITVLESFSLVALRQGDISGASKYRSTAEELRRAVEGCFDRDKYLRAFFSDGEKLGGEGFIDILPQAFSAFCGCESESSKTALKTAFDALFSPENGTFSLLFPPFSRPLGHDPGYIASYPEGVRENGGQYTHAAAWAIMAMNTVGLYDEAARAITGINPANISRTRDGAERYMGEPYFLAGDVTTAPELLGRCGWSIYTGSAGWMFNAIFASLLGIVIEEDSFTVSPSLSSRLPFFNMTFTFKDTVYEISAARGKGTAYVLDGKNVNNLFYFDKKYHYLEITVEISPEME